MGQNPPPGFNQQGPPAGPPAGPPRPIPPGTYVDAQGRPVSPKPGQRVVVMGTRTAPREPMRRTRLATGWLAISTVLLVAGAMLPFVRTRSSLNAGNSLWYYSPILLQGNGANPQVLLVVGWCSVLVTALGLLLGLIGLIGRFPVLIILVAAGVSMLTSLFLVLVAQAATSQGLKPGLGAYLLALGALGALAACLAPNLRRGWVRDTMF